MTVSSHQAAKDTQLAHITQRHPVPGDQQVFSDPASPDRSGMFASEAGSPTQLPAVLTARALERLALLPATDADVTRSKQYPSLQATAEHGAGFAGPLFLQSEFAARHYTQGIWDFGAEQVLLHGSFWDQLPNLLQVCSSTGVFTAF